MSVELLPDWNGRVAYVMKRMFITVSALALEMGVERTYAGKVLNTPRHGTQCKERVESALRSLAEDRGVDFEELWGASERQAQGADP